MNSLIANKLTTNMCLVLVKHFIVRTILCATVQICTTYTIIITTTTIRSLFSSQNYLPFCSQTFRKFCIAMNFKPQLFCSHKTDWILNDSLLSDLFCPFIIHHCQYNECSCNTTSMFLPSLELYRDFIFCTLLLRSLMLSLGYLCLSYSYWCC